MIKMKAKTIRPIRTTDLSQQFKTKLSNYKTVY